MDLGFNLKTVKFEILKHMVFHMYIICIQSKVLYFAFVTLFNTYGDHLVAEILYFKQKYVKKNAVVRVTSVVNRSPFDIITHLIINNYSLGGSMVFLNQFFKTPMSKYLRSL